MSLIQDALKRKEEDPGPAPAAAAPPPAGAGSKKTWIFWAGVLLLLVGVNVVFLMHQQGAREKEPDITVQPDVEPGVAEARSDLSAAGDDQVAESVVARGGGEPRSGMLSVDGQAAAPANVTSEPAPLRASVPALEPQTAVWPKLSCTGVAADVENPVVVINGQTLSVGDSIEDVKILKILKTMILMEFQGEKRVLRF